MNVIFNLINSEYTDDYIVNSYSGNLASSLLLSISMLGAWKYRCRCITTL